jgi:very-short-patch-repair endonuclease
MARHAVLRRSGIVARDVLSARRINAVIFRLAAERHGVVTRRELTSAGIPAHRVDHYVATGLLRPLHRGVYCVGPIATPLTAVWAGVLACGDDAVVSGRTAGGLWRMPLPTGAPAAVELVNVRSIRRRPGVRARRMRLGGADEVTRIEGIPVTSAPRTLLDLAAVISGEDLERVFAFAERERLVTITALTALRTRHPRHAGRRPLEKLLDTVAEPAFTQSEAEARLHALIRRSKLRLPATNVWLHGFKVDMYWEHARLVAEIDGYAYHSSRRSFEEDRERINVLAAHGIRVMRITWRQIAEGYPAIALLSGALGVRAP